jgi:prevent-host-death family protein
VNPQEARTQLSRLLALVEKGEEVVIARNGKPVAKLVAVEEPSPKGKRQLGTWRGRIVVPPEYFDPLPEDILKEWEEGPIFPEETDEAP